MKTKEARQGVHEIYVILVGHYRERIRRLEADIELLKLPQAAAERTALLVASAWARRDLATALELANETKGGKV